MRHLLNFEDLVHHLTANIWIHAIVQESLYLNSFNILLHLSLNRVFVCGVYLWLVFTSLFFFLVFECLKETQFIKVSLIHQKRSLSFEQLYSVLNEKKRAREKENIKETVFFHRNKLFDRLFACAVCACMRI